ncbi:MAG: hypothetical protein ACXW2Q_10575, partial [Thermoanaerobaculia bacterium]
MIKDEGSRKNQKAEGRRQKVSLISAFCLLLSDFPSSLTLPTPQSLHHLLPHSPRPVSTISR